MDAIGGFTFVLNGHLPYLPRTRHALVKFTGNALLPLVQTLYHLHADEIHTPVTLALSSLLLEQISLSTFAESLNAWFKDRIERAQIDQDFFQNARLYGHNHPNTAGDPHLVYLSEWHIQHYQQLQRFYNDTIQQDIVGTCRTLQDAGAIEIMAAPATHAYLPLLGHDAAIKRQIKLGIANYERVFGRRPTAFWLPYLGYRPGLEDELEAAGIQVFVCESHTLTGGPTVGVAAGQVMGPAHSMHQTYIMPQAIPEPTRDTSTMRPYYVGPNSNIAVIARDNRSVMQVAGNELGYPRDVDYLEPERHAATSGLRYWRVTNYGTAQQQKDYYHPEWAGYKMEQHAEHFAHLIGDMLYGYHNASSGGYGFIASVFDIRLFGSWFEGTQWLEHTLRHLNSTTSINIQTLSQFVSQHPPQQRVDLLEGSWGAGGQHFMVDNPETRDLWQQLYAAENRLEAARPYAESPEAQRVFNQALRELLLMQTCDWAVMMLQTPTLAAMAFETYANRFDRLLNSLEAGTPDTDLVGHYQETDYILADLDLTP